jgi:hypothetical protein
MLGVDLGNQQRDVIVHPMVFGVAQNDVAGSRKVLFYLTGDR